MCNCGNIVREINERPPVVYYSADEGFLILGQDRRPYVIQHCPWCGGRLPKAITEALIAPPAEYDRLYDLGVNIGSPDGCSALFGVPDYDRPLPDEMGLLRWPRFRGHGYT
jgi:hypothetical protein